MAVNDEDLLAAVSAAVDSSGTTQEPISAESSDTTADDAAVDDNSGDGAGSDSADASAAGSSSDSTTTEGDGAETDAKLGPDGKPLVADDKSAADAAKLTAAATDAAKPAGKVADPINDPIDNRLKDATKTRITSLVETAKKLTTDVQAANAQRDEIIGLIQETGATPQQYGQTLDYLRLVNSSNRADQENALAMMQAEVAALSRMLGKAVPGVDLVSEHEDLTAAVRDGDISRQHAEELAAARAQRTVSTARDTNQRQNDQQQAAQQREVETARAALNNLQTQLLADPAFEHKKAILIKTLKPVFAQIPPSQWAGTFKAAYDALPAPAAPVAVPAARLPTNTPLRPNNPAGSPGKPAGSALDAMNLALGVR